jgi:hypothetical protein
VTPVFRQIALPDGLGEAVAALQTLKSVSQALTPDMRLHSRASPPVSKTSANSPAIW